MRYRNAVQRDPALARAFDNLAGLFAPPSGADFAASANAQATRADAERRAWLFNNSADPTASARSSLLGIQNYGQTPSGFGKTLDVTRRGQDIDASTKLRQTELQQSGETTRTMLAPVAQGATRFNPESIQQFYGVPPTQTGVVELKPGEQSVLPDGRTLSGPAKPPTMDEVKARVFQQMPQDQQSAIVFANTPIEQIVLDGRNVNALRPNSIGQTPVPPAGQTPKAFIGQLADGRQVPAVQRQDGSFAHAQTGERLPDDIKPFNVPTPTGKNEDVGLGTTANKTAAGSIRGAVANADALIRQLDQTIRSNPASAGLAANVLSFAQDMGQVFREFGEKFGNTDTPVSFGDLQAIANRVAPGGYNPVYRQVRAQLLELAYANARLDNPRGEVSRFALERQIEALGLGAVGNDQSVLAVLDTARGRLRRSLTEADVLDGTAPAPTAGSLYAPQGGPTAQPNAPQQPRQRLRFDANGNPVQ